MATVVADIPASAAAPIAESDLLFKTSFLRDGASGKSFAIVQANDSVNTVDYTVYERSSELFSTRSFSGSVAADAPVFSFTINKGSKYWIVASINGQSNLVHFEVDPNKRRLGVGAGKKRAAPADAAPADAAAAPATPAAAAPDAEKPAASTSSAPKTKKIKA